MLLVAVVAAVVFAVVVGQWALLLSLLLLLAPVALCWAAGAASVAAVVAIVVSDGDGNPRLFLDKTLAAAATAVSANLAHLSRVRFTYGCLSVGYNNNEPSVEWRLPEVLSQTRASPPTLPTPAMLSQQHEKPIRCFLCVILLMGNQL